MIDPALWVAFAAASLLMGLIPGPGVASIVGYAMSSGRKTALASVAGMALGTIIAMSVSLAGVGALLAASAAAFTILKFAGAAYLIALGLIAIFARPGGDSETQPRAAIAPRTAFLGNIAVGTFHPKTIIFFVAFVPQFISPHGSYLVQAAILTVTFGLVVACTDTLYALAASGAARALDRPSLKLWAKRGGGGILIAAGVATAAARKT
jgi:threonine/homoserine/homoserine lactone efflux protein